MKQDLVNRKDIEKLVNTFYDKVKTDHKISIFFNEVAKVNWVEHLPQMYDFWESILFSKNVFNGNPMRKHIELNAKQPLAIEHFDHWLQLFTSTTDEIFSGQNSEKIKQYAAIIKENLSARVLTKNQIGEPTVRGL
jgi:hemoglobin